MLQPIRNERIVTSHTSHAVSNHISVEFERSKGHKDQLMKEKKLILLLDLDHTIMHATCDNDFGNCNKIQEAKKKFSLLQSEIHEFEAGGRKYYIKIRPKAHEFLEKISEFFEINVYTASERDYANHIVKLLDPSGKFIGNRVLTRTESSDMVRKFIERLFPFSAELVVIVDDSVNAWAHDKGVFHLYKIPRFYFWNSTKKKQNEGVETEEQIKKEIEEAVVTEEGIPKLKWINPSNWNDLELTFCENALLKVRNIFYLQPADNMLSVNHVLNQVRENVLDNVHILFSSVVGGEVNS